MSYIQNSIFGCNYTCTSTFHTLTKTDYSHAHTQGLSNTNDLGYDIMVQLCNVQAVMLLLLAENGETGS